MVRKAHIPPTRHNQDEDGYDATLGYRRCSWNADGEQCRYPGSLSNTVTRGNWVCRLHYECRDAIQGAIIVAASLDYKHQGQAEKDRHHQAQADETCKRLGLETIAQKRAWLKNHWPQMAAFDTAPPREPGDDDEPLPRP